jgi:hypothetical protein
MACCHSIETSFRHPFSFRRCFLINFEEQYERHSIYSRVRHNIAPRSNRGLDHTELRQMQLFVQSEAEYEKFAEVSRVLHLAVMSTEF